MRDAWLANIPSFPSIGAKPDPGIELLEPLLAIDLPEVKDLYQDIPGLRSLTLWEAIFLFHKCSHTHLAAQRLGQEGMHSWCLFNSYHSAYLGARGAMALLGITLPNLRGKQIAIDLYPEPVQKRTARSVGTARFEEFLIVRLPGQLDQRNLWEAFQRVLRMSESQSWDNTLREALLDLSWDSITPPRNHFLYKSHYWPLDDLIADGTEEDLQMLFGTELSVEEEGFLLRLSFTIYRLFEQMIVDLSKYSSVIREQLDGSRFQAASQLPAFACYKKFLSQIGV